MTCSKCGATILATARFCGDCGTPVEPSAVHRFAAVPARAPRNDAFAKTLVAESPVPPPPAPTWCCWT
jgi:predicted amidophosphoribosyltransferase